MERFSAKELDRFEACISPEPNTGCWLWMPLLDRDGYGRFRAGGRQKYAHRASFEHDHGPVPSTMSLDHLCRNRACVNPRHLEIVTQLVNVRRGATPKIDADTARAVFMDPGSQRAASATYGIHHITVWMIRQRKTWRDATEGLLPPARKRNQWR